MLPICCCCYNCCGYVMHHTLIHLCTRILNNIYIYHSTPCYSVCVCNITQKRAEQRYQMCVYAVFYWVCAGFNFQCVLIALIQREKHHYVCMIVGCQHWTAAVASVFTKIATAKNVVTAYLLLIKLNQIRCIEFKLKRFSCCGVYLN